MVAQIDWTYVRTAGFGATLRRAASYLFFEGRPATTRGQWFNPVVRANLAIGGMRGSVKPLDRPIFIVGVGRSGTTHLGRLLSAHPNVGWLNEPKIIWNFVLPDEDISGFYSSDGRFRFEGTDASSKVVERATRVFHHYLASVNGKRLVDKYPELTYRIPFLKGLFPDAKIVAIVRRPEDFVNSVSQWNEKHTFRDQDWWGVAGQKWTRMLAELVSRDPEVLAALRGCGTPSSAEMAATEWVLGMRSLVADSNLVDMVLRFEDLAADPVSTMSSVMRICELGHSTRVLQLAREATSSRLRHEAANFGSLADLVEQTRRTLGV